MTQACERSFFGRRRGKRLRAGRAASYESRLPALLIDPASNPPDDIRHLFAAPVDAVRIEIGFGGGEHLLHRMSEHPSTGFIGIEPFIDGMAKLVGAVAERGAKNLRVYDDDAVDVLDWLPARCADAVDLLYPDPWPKKKHWKRRFVSRANLDRMARVLRPGGAFRFASDIDSYVNWTLLRTAGHPEFVWTAATAADWHEPFAGWPGTRYEAKAIREGRQPAYLTFRRR